MLSDRSEQFSRALFVADVTLTSGALLLSWGLYHAVWPAEEVAIFSHLALLPLFLAFLIYALTYFDGYAGPRMATRFTYAWAAVRSVCVSATLLVTLLFLLKIQYVSRAVFLTFAFLTLLFLIANRLVAMDYFRRSLRQGVMNLKVLIIGTGPRAIRLARKLRTNAEWGLDIVGHLDPDAKLAGHQVEDARVIGTIDDITSVLKGNVVDEVILAIPRAMIPNVDRIAQACEEEGVTFRLMADVFDVHVTRMRLAMLDDIPLLTLEPIVQDLGKLMIKRTVDLAVALLVLPPLLVLFGIIGLAIKIDSPGPVLFLQERVGLNKRRFKLVKFRTMVVGAEARLSAIEHLNEASGPIFKIKHDPRVTRVGGFLRRTSLDEFPQFINVLRGEMSLVGPRPMSIRDVDLFDKGVQRKRFGVKPGLACLREVSGRSDLSFAEWLALDLQYIENWSLGLDLKIFLKLLPTVLNGRGAV